MTADDDRVIDIRELTDLKMCKDPNCLVCCDQETFDRLTKKTTEEVRDYD